MWARVAGAAAGVDGAVRGGEVGLRGRSNRKANSTLDRGLGAALREKDEGGAFDEGPCPPGEARGQTDGVPDAGRRHLAFARHIANSSCGGPCATGGGGLGSSSPRFRSSSSAVRREVTIASTLRLPPHRQVQTSTPKVLR